MMLKKCKPAHTDRDCVPSERYTVVVLKPSRQTCRIFKIIDKIYENFLTRNSRLQKPFGGLKSTLHFFQKYYITGLPVTFNNCLITFGIWQTKE